MPVQTIVMDIEGTTGATEFMVGRLYPYATERFAAWIDDHHDDPDLVRAVAQVRDRIGEPAADTARIVAVLRAWAAADEKITPLKTVQGKIWQHGFACGDLVSDFYPDVIPALRTWAAAGRQLGVFSSGSAAAQRSWFGHSPDGDLGPLMSGYFDTDNAGPKRKVDSYRGIATALGVLPNRAVYLSDVMAELDAARAAGWRTVGVRRPGEPYADTDFPGHLVISSFAELDVSGDLPLVRRRRGAHR